MVGSLAFVRTYLRALFLTGLLAVLAACGGGGGDHEAKVTGVVVTPSDPTVFVGGTVQMSAVLQMSDGSTSDITSAVEWSSADVSVMTVSSAGLIKGIKAGTAKLSGSYDGYTGSVDVTVSAVEPQQLTIDPASVSLAKGTSQQLKATVLYNNGSKTDISESAAWSSSSANATVSNDAGSHGKTTGANVGTATITATYSGLTATSAVTVTAATLTSLSVEPATMKLAKGTSGSLKAIGTFTDGTHDVTDDASWSSSSANVTVGDSAGSKGKLTAVSVGGATITASYGGKSATSAATVTDATVTSIQVTPTNPSLAKGTTKQLKATAVFSDASTQDVTTSVVWSSATPLVISVDAKGLAKALDVGTSTVTAALDGSGASGSTDVTGTAATPVSLAVTPATASIAKGSDQKFIATATYTDGSTQNVNAAWTSATPAVATISNADATNGVAHGVAEGSSDISASYAGLSTTAAKLTVTAATVSSVEVTPVGVELPVGLTKQFTATAIYTDGSKQDVTAADGVVWSSSDVSVIEIGNAAGSKGFARAAKAGSVTLSAAFAGKTGSVDAKATSATLTALQVTPLNRSLAAGFKLPYQATGTFSDGSKRDVTGDVTWTSSDKSIATVDTADSRGLVTGVAAGPVSIKAESGTVSGSATLTVTVATLSSVQLTPSADQSLPLGTTQRYTATGTFSDSTTLDITTQVTWSSSDTTIASVDTTGLLTTVSPGGPITVKAEAPKDGKSGSTLVTGSAKATVTDAALRSIAVTPATAKVAKGEKQQFTATGAYSDGTTKDITVAVTWSSSNAAIAVVSNAPDNGLATSVAEGTATITATLGSISGSSTLTVTAATLTKIVLTPDTASIPKGRAQQFRATGTYTDASTKDVTNAATWTSSAPEVATVTNASENSGGATGLTTGTTTITATLSGLSGTAKLTVTDAVLDHVEILPSAPSTALNVNIQLTATAVFSDNTTQDATNSVTWSSSDTSIVDVSNSAGSKGMAYAKTVGNAKITASLDTKSVTVTFTVTAPTLNAIIVQPAASSIPVGYGLQYKAIGQYSDGDRDITTSVSWSTLNPAIVTIDDSAAKKGFAQAKAAGSTTVRAVLGGIEGTTTAGAVSTTLSSIAVTPADASIKRGETLQYTAIGTFANSQTLDLTTQVTWASSNRLTATIDANGLATAGGIAGTTSNITATLNSVVGTTTLKRVAN